MIKKLCICLLCIAPLSTMAVDAVSEEKTVFAKKKTSKVKVIKHAPTTFKNCTALRKYYPKGVDRAHPAYAKKLDRNRDGWACEIK